MSKEILNALNEMELYDVHTHLDAKHITARGLSDILLYHMVVTELYSAGCPSGDRIPEFADSNEIERRIEEAIPYLPKIANTSLYKAVKDILKDLYDWEEPIELGNWRILDELIKKKSADKSWYKEIAKKAGVKRASTELGRRHGGILDEFLSYSIEWGFFARAQWNQFDTALLELENTWDKSEPGEPLPVNAVDIKINKHIRTVDDINEAMEHYFKCIPVDMIISAANHISTDINFSAVTDEQMAEALKNRAHATEKERDIYASYVFDVYIKNFAKYCKGRVFQFSLGAEPLPFETGSKLRTESVFHLAKILADNKDVHFQLLLSSAHANQAISTLVREFPNFSVAGYWWHNFFPSFIKRIITERLEMLPMNKQVGFFSDAYCMEWLYGKSKIVKKVMASVLEEKITNGDYTFDEAIKIANRILSETPKQLYNM